MRRSHAARKSTLLAHNWAGSTFRFGKMSPRDADANAPPAPPHVGPVDPDFDSLDCLLLETQDGHYQRVTLAEAA